MYDYPKTEESVFIVRIAQSAKTSLRDYDIMRDRSSPHSLLWDSDAKNHIKVGDWLGFIVGETYDATVTMYHVKEVIDPTERPPHWEKLTYTHTVEPSKPVKLRNVIRFSDTEPIRFSWESWKHSAGYKGRYMPRGTIRAKFPWYNPVTTTCTKRVARKPLLNHTLNMIFT